MFDAIKSGRDPKTQQYSATALSKWAKTLPSMFPPATGEDQLPKQSQARTAIWQDRAGFDKAAADYADATARLVALAVGNDTGAFPKQLDAVKQTCNSCHSRYKAGPQSAPSK